MRTQGNYNGDEASRACRQDFSQPVIVRQEFGPQSDIKTIIARHGGYPPPPRPAQFTETDYNKDLAVALAELKRAHAAFEELPKKYKEQFQTADELWHAYRTGALNEKPAVDKATTKNHNQAPPNTEPQWPTPQQSTTPASSPATSA